MPYVLLIALTFDDKDLAGPVPPAVSPVVEELGLINSWYLNHPKFFRIFVLLRHYSRDRSGAVTVLPGLAPRRKLLRFSLGLAYLCLWCSPLLLLF